ncbi:hypothetical protein N7478_000555 [Penicillium angulare]|uniref:uncharacterized protein n=1 Tax=Penicillium angulare TaxID=116970 RepID=UPI002541C8A8|nr:uncharacterized protein N7478_000555 [Penicillium angulare]KAJ5291304.1 hypothetical protein N7478_000555 [Penicillium angulare]
MLARPIDCELRLESPDVFLGSPREDGANKCVTGHLALQLRKPTLIRSIKVQLRGTLKIHSKPLLTNISPRKKELIRNDREVITFDVTKSLAISETGKPFKLQRGSHSFRFEIFIDKPLFETVDGLDSASHSYQVHGIIERPWGNQQIITKPLIIYGNYENDQYLSWLVPNEYYDPLVLQKALNDIHYEIILPARDIPFGAMFPAHIRLLSDMKSLYVKHIMVKVIETHNFEIPATAFEQTNYNVRFLRSQKTRFVTGDDVPLLPGSYSAREDVTPGDNWEITSTLALPRQLQDCIQSARLPYLDIKHFLSVEIALQVADDLVTINETVPFRIFMPASPVNSAFGPGAPQMNLRELWVAPPPYGKHETDSLLADSC